MSTARFSSSGRFSKGGFSKGETVEPVIVARETRKPAFETSASKLSLQKNGLDVNAGKARSVTPGSDSAVPAPAARKQLGLRSLDGALSAELFDPNSPDLNTSWSSYAEVIYCLNTYPNGITLSVHQNNCSEPVLEPGDGDLEAQSLSEAGGKTGDKFAPQQFHLRFRDTRDYQLPSGRYYLHRENYAVALEAHLSQLRKSGKLGSSVWYFGTTTDPFLSLHKKFDVTMACIELLERYVPGMLVFQTRSPMIISVLPALKGLGEKAVVAMPIETIAEKAIARYSPGKPKIGERLIAAEGLRRQGVKVNLVASPVLPYGDPKRDAWDFAEVLERHADYVTFGSLATGAESDEKQLKSLPICQKLESDQQFFWLRPHSYQHVYQAFKTIAPEKLQLPVKKPQAPSQLKLFAA